MGRPEQPSQSEPVAQPVAAAAQPERKEVPKDLVPPQTFSKCKRGRQKVRPLRLMPLRLTIAPGMSPYTLLSAPVRCDDVDISLSLLCSQICSR